MVEDPYEMELGKISYGNYSAYPVFQKVKDIAGFQLVASIPPLGRAVASHTDLLNMISTRTYAAMLDILRASGFHSPEQLELTASDASIAISYDDDRYGFRVTYDPAGKISIRRDGSSMERFHEWYIRLMPSAQSIIDNICVIIAETSMLQDKFERQFDVLRAWYDFSVVAYDFVKGDLPASKQERNSVLMARLLTLWPDVDGGLVPSAEMELDRLGRIDVRVSRWTGDREQGRSRELYSVEAPGNRLFSSLWFSFTYIGETYEGPHGERESFDSGSFLANPQVPYISFFRDKALSRFLISLTDGYVFRTTADRLP